MILYMYTCKYDLSQNGPNFFKVLKERQCKAYGINFQTIIAWYKCSYERNITVNLIHRADIDTVVEMKEIQSMVAIFFL